ncbi:uncharacterized protein LOC130742865 isoform X2 [Lotus japonicus]|uniref:uncharacterized protein LOC130742865 isoform X2 n=1 Tax=Lotus japonicus TaxID=34305 RepID=UPI0025890E65|nr:uncharacterized protein LOC130742865 isoform X2 [Lotus japonicus]
MKSVSKNKFLTCFRPVVDIDAMTMLDSGPALDRSATRHITDKHDTRNSSTKSIFSDPKSVEDRVVRQPSKRAFAKNTRARNKKLYSQSCFGSRRSYSAHADSSSTGNGKSTMSLVSLDSNIKEIKTMELSLSSPSPSSSRVSEDESCEDQLEKQNKCLLQGICMILISLAVTVLWGKIDVIILTSMLFCICSVWNRRKEVAKLWKTDSNASKNRENSGRTRLGKKFFLNSNRH